MPFANANLHRAELSTTVTLGAHAVLIVDSAGWDQTGDTPQVQGTALLHPPPYVPGLNAVETIRAHPRSNKLSNRVADRYADAIDACCDA